MPRRPGRCGQWVRVCGSDCQSVLKGPGPIPSSGGGRHRPRTPRHRAHSDSSGCGADRRRCGWRQGRYRRTAASRRACRPAAGPGCRGIRRSSPEPRLRSTTALRPQIAPRHKGVEHARVERACGGNPSLRGNVATPRASPFAPSQGPPSRIAQKLRPQDLRPPLDAAEQGDSPSDKLSILCAQPTNCCDGAAMRRHAPACARRRSLGTFQGTFYSVHNNSSFGTANRTRTRGNGMRQSSRTLLAVVALSCLPLRRRPTARIKK
jgi:hypothetical protein